MTFSTGDTIRAIELLLSVGAILFAALVWRMRGEFAGKKELVELLGKLQGMADRVTAIEVARAQNATRSDIATIALELSELRGDVKTQDAQLVALNKRIEDMMNRVEPAIDRVEEYLLQNAGRK
jgi:hypothetical protein